MKELEERKSQLEKQIAEEAIARPPSDAALTFIPVADTCLLAENHAYVEVPMRAAATRSIASAGINFFIM